MEFVDILDSKYIQIGKDFVESYAKIAYLRKALNAQIQELDFSIAASNWKIRETYQASPKITNAIQLYVEEKERLFLELHTYIEKQNEIRKFISTVELDIEEKAIIIEKYFNKQSYFKILKKLSLRRSTFYRKLNNALYRIGKALFDAPKEN